MKELLVATHNNGKVKEFAELLGPYVQKFTSAAGHHLPEPAETGSTFAANAILKAQAAFDATGIPCLADDSGLAVDCLNGDPGIYSARWAETKKGRDFNFAMDKVLAAVADFENKGAQFVCALALILPNQQPHVFEGIIRGSIVAKAGENGFGYDPIFQPTGYECTLAELPTTQKQAISHRAVAFKKLTDSGLLV